MPSRSRSKQKPEAAPEDSAVPPVPIPVPAPEIPESERTATTPETVPAVKTRLITSLQSLGRIGKSTLSQALLSWADYAGIPSAAIDADDEHRTLSGWYREDALTLPFRGRDDLLPLLDAAGQAPLEIVDFPAQATEMILTGFHDFNALAMLAERGVRLTVALFASGERAGLLSAHKIITELGTGADYLIVTNPARFRSGAFETSAIPGMIPDAGRVHLPVITPYTLEHLDAAGKRERRALTFAGACPLLNSASRHELQAWLNSAFRQFEDNAALLVPGPGIIKNRILRAGAGGASRPPVNPYDL